MKPIADLYRSAHRTVAAKQHARYGNPLTEAPDHVPAVLESAVQAGTLTNEQARKLASHLGRVSYGERGLTDGICNAAIETVCGFSALPWHVKAQLSHELAG